MHLHNIVRGLPIFNIYQKERKVPLVPEYIIFKVYLLKCCFFHGPLYMCTFVQSMHPNRIVRTAPSQFIIMVS